MKRKPVILAALAACLLGGYWIFGRRQLTSFPVLPIPKPFPGCADVAADDYDWHGLRFKYPKNWTIHMKNDDFGSDGSRELYVRPPYSEGMRTGMQSIQIVEFKDYPPIKAALAAARSKDFDYKKVDMLGPRTIPQTIQTVQFENKNALIFLRREMGLMPRENDQWALLIDLGSTQLYVGGPTMLNPYFIAETGELGFKTDLEKENKEIDCAYWLVMRNLKLP